MCICSETACLLLRNNMNDEKQKTGAAIDYYASSPHHRLNVGLLLCVGAVKSRGPAGQGRKLYVVKCG